MYVTSLGYTQGWVDGSNKLSLCFGAYRIVMAGPGDVSTGGIPNILIEKVNVMVCTLDLIL